MKVFNRRFQFFGSSANTAAVMIVIFIEKDIDAISSSPSRYMQSVTSPDLPHPASPSDEDETESSVQSSH